MAFFKRLFSSDYRAAVAAEAAGELEMAAERYALAGRPDAAARIHLARAERADDRAAEISALRDALHWAPEEGDWRRRSARALGEALLARARAEAVATERDRDRVREAAALLTEAGAHREAGEAYESIGDDRAAARAFELGGLVERMEEALRRADEGHDRQRRERSAFADYELCLRGGDRDGAATALRECIAAAEDRSEYRRLLDDLESRRLSSGSVTLRVRRGHPVTVSAAREILLGRDALCDLVLHSTGISRRHARVRVGASGGDLSFELADAGSKNGTLIGGMPIGGAVALAGSGSFDLGEHCTVDYRVSGAPAKLSLEVTRGVDAGKRLFATGEDVAVDLADAGVDARLVVRKGRPILLSPAGGLTLNGERLVEGDVQLLRGDELSIDGVELEVEP